MKSNSLDRLVELEKEIDNVREYERRFFIVHPAANENDKTGEIRLKTDKIYKEALLSDDTTGKKYLIGGMALNIAEAYDQRCEDSLSNAVRLLPTDTRAWNELGQCISKREEDGDPSLVRSIFSSSLSISRSASTLALLSISIRATLSSLSPEEASLARAESLSLARESIVVDEYCGDGWMSLANALLSAFFFDGQKNSGQLEESIESYQKAMDNGLEYQSDLHLNLSTALRYQCHLKKSLDHLEKAFDCDRSTLILDQLNEYKAILKRMDESIGHLNEKGNGELMLNENEPVTGIVVQMLTPKSLTPSLLLLTPPSFSSPVVVALLNCSSSLSLLIGDSVQIPSFELLQYSSTPLLRIRDPSTILRNGVSLSSISLALASVSIQSPSSSSSHPNPRSISSS